MENAGTISDEEWVQSFVGNGAAANRTLAMARRIEKRRASQGGTKLVLPPFRATLCKGLFTCSCGISHRRGPMINRIGIAAYSCNHCGKVHALDFPYKRPESQIVQVSA